MIYIVGWKHDGYAYLCADAILTKPPGILKATPAILKMCPGLKRADWAMQRQRRDTPRRMVSLCAANDICLPRSRSCGRTPKLSSPCGNVVAEFAKYIVAKDKTPKGPRFRGSYSARSSTAFPFASSLTSMLPRVALE